MDSSFGIAYLPRMLPFPLLCGINLQLLVFGAHNTVIFSLRFSPFVLHKPVCILLTNHANMALTLHVWILSGIKSPLYFASLLVLIPLEMISIVIFKRIWSF